MNIHSDQILSTEDMVSICSQVLHCDRNLSSKTINRRSCAVFGIQPKTCVFLWFHLEGLLPVGAEPKHLLWALSFLKLYEVEEGRASRLQVDEKTCRKWTKIFIRAISKLNLVRSCHNYLKNILTFTIRSTGQIDYANHPWITAFVQLMGQIVP